MIYLRSFDLATELAETEFFCSFPPKLEMLCYDRENAYPFKIFPPKYFSRAEFEPITIFYGGNGSGKSTLLNVIACKLGLERAADFNETPLYEDYLALCSYDGAKAPKGSRIITSDDVFDYLLDLRAVNRGVEARRQELFREYEGYRDPSEHFQMRTMAEYEELKIRNEARKKTKSAFVSPRLASREVRTRSNGESAFYYFTEHIKENALYLLDEPENSLSPRLQWELASFLADSARFFGCQFIISTHSPFLLAMKGAKIYDLDAAPACEKKWTELEGIKIYKELFDEK
ncbi:MAG: AAA family ATPase [Clostridia bacterium]|nr:AAA family ATPase [Clostridia bacterium]